MQAGQPAKQISPSSAFPANLAISQLCECKHAAGGESRYIFQIPFSSARRSPPVPTTSFFPSLRMQTCSGRESGYIFQTLSTSRPPFSSCPHNLVFPKFANANLQRAGNPVTSFKLYLHPPAALYQTSLLLSIMLH